MSNRVVYRYQLKCLTEELNVFVWSDVPPTTCPNNNTHSIDSTSISIIETVAENTVTVLEEKKPTQGLYRMDGHTFDILPGPNVTTLCNVSYPYPITAIDMIIQQEGQHYGDIINVVSSPNTIIGVLTNNVSIGDTVLSVSPTVLDIIKLGYSVTLNDGVQQQDMGDVININKTTSQLTINNASTKEFLATSPTMILLNIYLIRNHRMTVTHPLIIGIKKIGGSYIPEGIINQLQYTNLTSDAKKISVSIDILY